MQIENWNPDWIYLPFDHTRSRVSDADLGLNFGFDQIRIREEVRVKWLEFRP